MLKCCIIDAENFASDLENDSSTDIADLSNNALAKSEIEVISLSEKWFSACSGYVRIMDVGVAVMIF